MNKEPLLTVASVTAFTVAAIALLVSFGIPVSDAQSQAILGVVAVVAPLVVAGVARGKVTPTVKRR